MWCVGWCRLLATMSSAVARLLSLLVSACTVRAAAVIAAPVALSRSLVDATLEPAQIVIIFLVSLLQIIINANLYGVHCRKSSGAKIARSKI